MAVLYQCDFCDHQYEQRQATLERGPVVAVESPVGKIRMIGSWHLCDTCFDALFALKEEIVHLSRQGQRPINPNPTEAR